MLITLLVITMSSLSSLQALNISLAQLQAGGEIPITMTEGVPITVTVVNLGGTPPSWSPDESWCSYTQAEREGLSFTIKCKASIAMVYQTYTLTLKVTYSTPPPTTYALTVSSGTGGGTYAAGTSVSITANAAPAGQQFKNWTSSGGGTFGNANSASTTFTMPASAVTITANYEPIQIGRAHV